MIQSIPNAQPNNLSLKEPGPRHAPLSQTQGMSVGVIIATGVAAIIALHAVSFLAQMLLTPIICGLAIGIAVHIVLRGPKESLECGAYCLEKIPGIAQVAIQKAPAAIEQIGVIGVNLGDLALQNIGSRVNPPSDHPYTLTEVAQGLATEGATKAREAHKKASPVITQALKVGQQFAQKKCAQAQLWGVDLLTSACARIKNTFQELSKEKSPA